MADKRIDLLRECSDFEHFISLGHCCFVAIELEKLGLRDASMPFDWVRTRWRAIERSFNTRFSGYLNYDDLYQKKTVLHAYKNLEYGVGFFHDFVDYKSLKNQIKSVQDKYERRIDRFFNNITERTLFIRYMWDDDELLYVSNNYAMIESMIKEYNSDNEIVFISHSDSQMIDTSKIKYIFFIDKNADEELNDLPISSNVDLYNYLLNINYKNRKSNLAFNENKKNRKKRYSIVDKIKRKYFKMVLSKKKYIHDKKC